MFDKFEIKTDKINKDALNNLGHLFIKTQVQDKNYRESYIFRNIEKKQIVTIKLNPFFPSASFCSFEMNPNNIGDFKKTNELIGIIASNNLTFKRIDFAVDIERPIDEIKNIIKVNHKRARFDYTERDQLTGIEFGKDQEIVCIYDKAYEKLQKKKYKKIDGVVLNQLTRIEVRQRSKKIPFKSYDEILNYMDFNPFANIKFYKLDNVPSLNNYRSYKANKLINTIGESGTLHGAVKRLNKHYNFNRDFNFIARDFDLENLLYSHFKFNLENFFGV